MTNVIERATTIVVVRYSERFFEQLRFTGIERGRVDDATGAAQTKRFSIVCVDS